MGSVRFGVPRELVLWLRDTFNIRTFVETGTNQAETTIWAAGEFDQVITIEGYEPLHQKAINAFGSCRNIRFLLGDSRRLLPEVLQSLDGPAIFWLDAHWCGADTYGSGDECPVLGELEVLNAWGTPHFVLVDDARLFLAPPPAPHRSDDWPGINAICRAMDEHVSNRYVAVFEDVIVGVPFHARKQFVEWLRTHMERPVVLPTRRSRCGRWLRRITGRISRETSR